MTAEWYVGVADALAWMTIMIGTGYLAHRLPDRVLERDNWLLRPRRFERGGRFYERWFAVRRWKDLLPEGGGAFRGGRSKSRLFGHDRAGLEAYARETRRAELAHWMAVVPTPLFALWNPAWLMPFMVAFAVVVNAPCIVVVRYNRLRIGRLLSSRRSAPGAR